MIIIVSGTPGTGKTTVAKAIAQKKNLKYLDVHQLIEKHHLSEGYDRIRKCKIVDIKRLVKFLLKEIEISKKEKVKGVIIDSHLSHYLPPKSVDQCIITTCNLKVLEKRLKKRKYSAQKVRENLDAEIFEICKLEALELGHKVKIVDTS